MQSVILIESCAFSFNLKLTQILPERHGQFSYSVTAMLFDLGFKTV